MRRAWQLFDWVRGLPEGHDLRRLCDVGTYVTMITLCGPWQQLRRALQLVAEMRALSLEAGAQVWAAPSPASTPAAGCCHLSRMPHMQAWPGRRPSLHAHGRPRRSEELPSSPSLKPV